MKTRMYQLKDTFNNQIISRHRTIEAAARAEVKFSRAVKRSNGEHSYIPTVCVCPDGGVVDSDEWLSLTNDGY